MAIRSLKFQKQVTVAAGQTVVVIIPTQMNSSSVAVYPEAGGSALVKFSLSPIDDIANDAANVKWVDWSNGTVTEATANDAQSPINAYSCAATAQPCVFEVLAS